MGITLKNLTGASGDKDNTRMFGELIVKANWGRLQHVVKSAEILMVFIY